MKAINSISASSKKGGWMSAIAVVACLLLVVDTTFARGGFGGGGGGMRGGGGFGGGGGMRGGGGFSSGGFGGGAPAEPVVLSRNGRNFPVYRNQSNVRAGTEIKVTTERPDVSLSLREMDEGSWVIFELPGFTIAAAGTEQNSLDALGFKFMQIKGIRAHVPHIAQY